MPSATIKSKSGAVISIQGTEKEVASIIRLLERENHDTSTSPKGRPAKKRTAPKGEMKRAGATDLIVNMLNGGFFNKPKTLNEIEAALEEKGYLYPVTTLSGVMLGLVNKKLFGRKKMEGKWVYGK